MFILDSRAVSCQRPEAYLAWEDLRSQVGQWELELPVAALDADLDTDQGVWSYRDVGGHVDLLLDVGWWWCEW
jgi:hypothetical protein